MQIEYPGVLEGWWIRRTVRHYGCESLHEREAQIERAVQALSDRFTTERTARGDYFDHEEALCAYGLFFFPQTFARTALVLREILSRGWNPEPPITMLDLGSGAGSASLSAAGRIPDKGVSLTAIDQSPRALDALQQLSVDCSSLWPLLECKTERADLRRWIRNEKRQWDIVLASFTLNEIELDDIDLLTGLLTDRGIAIVIEPALKFTSEKLESWRDQISLRSDLHIWGPCQHRQRCPLLEEGRYWCHEVRSWNPPGSLSFFNRHLYRQIHVLKFTFLAFGKLGPSPLESFAFRLISPVSRQKRHLIFTGCTTDGTKKDFRVSRALMDDEHQSVEDWERGDIVTSFR